MTTQERQAWLAERRKGIGGSDVAAILGVSPWATPLSVWLDKTGRSPDKPESEAMRIGTELEDFVARRYSEETNRKVQRHTAMLHRGCLLGNIDRLVVPVGEKVASHMGVIRTDTLLECKTTSVDWHGEVPVYYLTQVQHYMGLDDRLRHADVAVLNLLQKEFSVFRVERDDEAIEAMQRKCTEWWEAYVVPDVMPDATCEADNKLLWSLANPGKKVAADDEIRRKLDEFNAASDAEKAAKKAKDALKAEICAFMQDAAVLTGANGETLATWKNNKDSIKVDWESLAKSLNVSVEQIAAFTTTVAGARVFRPKSVKSETAA